MDYIWFLVVINNAVTSILIHLYMISSLGYKEAILDSQNVHIFKSLNVRNRPLPKEGSIPMEVVILFLSVCCAHFYVI